MIPKTTWRPECSAVGCEFPADWHIYPDGDSWSGDYVCTEHVPDFLEFKRTYTVKPLSDRQMEERSHENR